ncbi:hypothetical protein EGW08_004706 [Elysia chlorotica]|uniref:Uncharacterized protein n=1 Tax=Elysia chlorotica TaxID=188477 RepID=A0A3S1BN24_ELYCH|nr:hypothetical protein EGW08_004706 [Elysia chlorotica]
MLATAILLCVGVLAPTTLCAAANNDVSIEDFIDLYEAPEVKLRVPGNRHGSHDGHSLGGGVNHIMAPGLPTSASPSPSPSAFPSASPSSTPLPFSPSSTPTAGSSKTNNVIFDDEDIFVSGSGSGSGDFQPTTVTDDYGGENGRPTPTGRTASTPLVYSAPSSTVYTTDAKTPRELPVRDENPQKYRNDVNPDNTEWADEDVKDGANDNDDMFLQDDTLLFDYPAEHQAITSNHIITPPIWGPWSAWVNTGTSSKVRVRSCRAKGQEVNDLACDGVRLQVKTCNIQTGKCGVPKNVTNMALEGCKRESYKGIPLEKFKQAPPPPPRVPDAPPPLELRPSPDRCYYSLFDNFRQKFVFTRWNLTALITKSKVKRWCDKKSGQYLIMATPLEHCRRYYKDLCKVTQRCRATKTLTEAGDFAEGCWRNHVYGERLPVGLSNKRMKTFFICQRFAPAGQSGMTFGYKHTYFTTLYDINTRSPVISLLKVTSLGDDIWPETDYFIEHSLVEDEANMLWRYQKKPKKGMLTLGDLDRCQDDQRCDLGLRQVVPEDYHNSFPQDDQYTPTHLVWPEFMPADPGNRLSTFTLTNMAPMLKSLYREWRGTVLRIRQFAIDQCQIPYHLDLNVNHPGQQSTHRSHKSALYIASGALPNLDPVVTTGHDVHVPFLFWMSGCCVQHHAQGPATVDSSSNSSSSSGSSGSGRAQNDINTKWETERHQEDSKTTVSAFAVYVSNVAGSGVIAAPVLQLETLLQDVYKTEHDLDNVTLFPGHDGVCSDLKNDVSSYFQ